jgi:hypothetical protein
MKIDDYYILPFFLSFVLTTFTHAHTHTYTTTRACKKEGEREGGGNGLTWGNKNKQFF